MEEYLYLKSKKIPIYKGVFVIILSNSRKRTAKYVTFGKDTQTLFAHAFGGGEYKGVRAVIVVLNFNHPQKITHGVITHEVIHMISFLGQDLGFTMDNDNDEPIAYLAEWFTTEMYKFIKEKNFTVS